MHILERKLELCGGSMREDDPEKLEAVMEKKGISKEVECPCPEESEELFPLDVPVARTC